MNPDVAKLTNDQWLSGLRQGGEGGQAARQLHLCVRRGVARSLAANSNVCEDDLDDFAQDAVIRILDKLDTFRGDCRFTTWAVAVAIRVAFTALRKRRWGDRPLEDLDLGKVTPDTDERAQVPDPTHVAERNDLLEALRHAINHWLTDRQRTVILAELSGVPTTEIARQLGTNTNALYKLCHDARLKLQRALGEAGFTAEDVRRDLEKGSLHR